jgi:disulfide bond formation protein DsbB
MIKFLRRYRVIKNQLWKTSWQGTEKLPGLVFILLPFLLLPTLSLLGALGFQYIGGLLPCPLCIDQRIAHLATLIFAIMGCLAVALPRRLKHWPKWWPACRIGFALLLLAILATATGMGVAIFQVGVENRWWESGCASQAFGSNDLETLKNALLNTPVVRCDEVAWSMFGISMAGWNAVISFGLLAYGIESAIWGLRLRAHQPPSGDG